MALLLGGGRALLMQVAHPKVAEGVAEHSQFKSDPMGRLIQTMNTMWSIIFDEISQAEASLQRVQQVHQRVQGTIKQDDVLPVGTSYRAQDPDLLLWVHATLVDSALVTHGLFVAPMTLQEQRQYYDETKRLAVLLGVPESSVPASLEAFSDYVEEKIHSDAISVGSTAAAIAREILHPRPWMLRISGPLFAFITTGLLPPKLRRAYGLSWDLRREKSFQLLAGSVRTLLPLVPSALRVVPHARIAERKSTPAFKLQSPAAKGIH
jgi:uncharacterized protein (DUF2236 family)